MSSSRIVEFVNYDLGFDAVWSVLNKGVAGSSETVVTMYRNIWQNKTEGHSPHVHCHEYFTSHYYSLYVMFVCFARALSGWLFLILVAYCAWRLETCAVDSKDRFHSCCVVAVQLVMLPTAIWDLVSTAENIKNKQGLPGVNQIVSWSLLGELIP